MSEQLNMNQETLPLFNRVAIVEVLSELIDGVRLVDWLELDDEQVIDTLREYATRLNVNFNDLLEACLLQGEEYEI